jgi:hypothetical protein
MSSAERVASSGKQDLPDRIVAQHTWWLAPVCCLAARSYECRYVDNAAADYGLAHASGRPQQCLYFRPLPHGQGALRAVREKRLRWSARSTVGWCIMLAGGRPACSSPAMNLRGPSMCRKNALYPSQR